MPPFDASVREHHSLVSSHRALGIVLILLSVALLLVACGSSTPSQAGLVYQAPVATAATAPTRTPYPTAVPAARATPVTIRQTMYVCADGDGVTLRTDAVCSVRGPSGLADGTAVQVVSVNAGCSRVEAAGGLAGYVPSQYLCLAPVSTPTRAATATPRPAVAPVAPAAAVGCPGGCTSQQSGCAIKGNINSEGVHIYHVPSGRYYNATIINPAAGERWFCTEEEARAAGWRRSQQ
jgi:hypothetical protein